tara:strand:+ start:56 stop:832 length:777 start_codon:yes stop_codon:yes gene_type:complete
MNIKDLKIFYKENKKSSPLIIFIHGAACDHTLWCYQNRYFFNIGFSTLTLDLPGHGLNQSKSFSSISEMSSLINNLLKKLPQKNIILIGHSMGSLICLDVASLNSAKLKKVILVGISYPMSVSKDLLNKSKKNQAEAINDMIQWSLPSNVKLNGSKLIGLDLSNLVSVIMGNTPNGVLYQDLLACNNFSLKNESIKSIGALITIIAGEKDVMTPLKGAKKLIELLPNITFTSIKNIGHFHTLENPIEVNKIIKKSLEI